MLNTFMTSYIEIISPEYKRANLSLYAGGLEKPSTPEPKPAPRPPGEVAPWRLAGASPTTPASLRAIQDQEAAAGSQVGARL